MTNIFCFGELLLRMSPELNGRWIEDAATSVYIGGAELNTATALAGWKLPVKYGTALPDNYLTKEIIAAIRQRTIDTTSIHRSGNRIGLYYLPQGVDMKHAGVIYDRAGSSFAALTPGMIDWKEVLNDCSWFHFSAISPALNEKAAAVCEEALKAASELGLTISVDLNYRDKLWQYGKKPAEVMIPLINYCHVVMGNIWAIESLLGIASPVKKSGDKKREELIAAAEESMQQIAHAYANVHSIACTFRLEAIYYAVLQHENRIAISKEFQLKDIVDKVGSGDCFMAGLIYGLWNQHSPQEIIDFAAAAAVGKMQEKGDATRQTIESVLKIVSKKWVTTKQ